MSRALADHMRNCWKNTELMMSVSRVYRLGLMFLLIIRREYSIFHTNAVESPRIKNSCHLVVLPFPVFVGRNRKSAASIAC